MVTPIPSATSPSVHAPWDEPLGPDDVDSHDQAWAHLAMLSRAARTNPTNTARVLETLFVTGRPSAGLDGPCDLRLVTTMLGRPVDRFVGAIDDRVRPWVAKTFDATTERGENWLSVRPRHVTRIALLPAHLPVDGEVLRGLPFTTHVGPSAVHPDVDVLHIDYAGSRRNPPLMRSITRDEVVEIGPGVHLGLVHAPGRRGRRAPIGYFALRARNHR